MKLNSKLLKEGSQLADFVLFAQRSCVFDLAQELNRNNLNYPQFFLLAYLVGEDFLTMSAVAKKIDHSTAAATGLVDRLEIEGYVKREISKQDRRKMMVRITKKGIDFVDKQRKFIAESLAEMLQDADTDQAAFLQKTHSTLANYDLI